MGSTEIDYNVRRSDRASKPRIDVDLEGVTVIIPNNLSLAADRLVEEKRDWITKKLREMEQLRSRVPDRSFEEGAAFPYRGTDREVLVRVIERSHVTESAFLLKQQTVQSSSIKDELESLYRREARNFIVDILEERADELGVDYGTVRVKNQKTLWGSCSSKDNLNFNWRIMMAPPEIAEYVVLHELCHLVHTNHRDEFWGLLSDYVERPRQKARWLKDNAVELIFTEDDL